MNKHLFTSLLMIAIAAFAFGGDVAAFEDIGFSEDGNTYIFAQYGITDKNFQGYAEIYTVDIAENDFVPSGIFKTPPSENTVSISGTSIFQKLMDKNRSYINKYNPKPAEIKDILYEKPNDLKSGEEKIVVTDFEHSTRPNTITYTFTLVPFYEGKGENLYSSFYIVVEKTDKSGKLLEKKVVGTPDIKRHKISSYAIEKIMCTPDAKNFIIVVEKRSEENGVPTIRYMVEAFQL